MRTLGLALILGMFLAASSLASTLQQVPGSSTTLLNTEMDSKATNTYSAASSAYDNTVGQAGGGARICRFELLVVLGSNPTANTGYTVWLTREYVYGSGNFEPTPTSSIGPGAALTLFFPVNSGQTTTRGVIDLEPCPVGKWKATWKNEGTGQTSNGSGANTLKVTPIGLQVN